MHRDWESHLIFESLEKKKTFELAWEFRLDGYGSLYSTSGCSGLTTGRKAMLDCNRMKSCIVLCCIFMFLCFILRIFHRKEMWIFFPDSHFQKHQRNMDKQYIASRASHLQTREDLLNLLSEMKKDELGNAGYPFKMKQLT